MLNAHTLRPSLCDDHPAESEEERRQALLAALAVDLESVLAAAQPRLLRLAQQHGVSPDAADDVVQEALLVAWHRLCDLRTPERFDAWLDGICRNMSKYWRRKHCIILSRQTSFAGHSSEELEISEGALEEEITDPLALDPAEELDRKDLVTLLNRAMAYLSEDTRTALNLYYLAELPQREIAPRLGLTIKALEARRQLRHVLSNELRAEAETLGLAIDQEADAGWRETSFWCMFCGRQHLRGLFETLPDGRANLRMYCPDCQRHYGGDWIYSGWQHSLAGLRSFRPALKRLSQGVPRLLQDVVDRQTCSNCGAPAKMRLSPIDETISASLSPLMEGIARWQGITLILECSLEGPYATMPVGFAFWLHPAIQRFIAQHPRWIFEPETISDYAGQPALRICLTDITSAAQLLLLAHLRTLQVFAVIEQ
jgi:RNA polymerase sigma factor (sigma-70 family)